MKFAMEKFLTCSEDGAFLDQVGNFKAGDKLAI
jgi:hypothetical protein